MPSAVSSARMARTGSVLKYAPDRPARTVRPADLAARVRI